MRKLLARQIPMLPTTYTYKSRQTEGNKFHWTFTFACHWMPFEKLRQIGRFPGLDILILVVEMDLWLTNRKNIDQHLGKTGYVCLPTEN